MASRGTAPSPPEGAALLPLKKRGGAVVAYAIIDAEDFERLGGFRWHMKNDGYVARNIPHPSGERNRHGRMRQTQQRLHRDVMGLGYGDPLKVDHRDHNTLDNRKSNLRIGTHAQNLQNRVGANVGSSSKYRGVSWNKEARKWRAYASIDGKMHYLGDYRDEEVAAEVAANFRREHMPFTTN